MTRYGEQERWLREDRVDDGTADAGRAADAGEISRREAIRRVTALLGGITLVGSGAFVAGCARADQPGGGQEAPLFSDDEVAFLDEIAETILPTTDTPGAKAAAVGAFMALSVRDVYSLEDRRIFMDGMRALEAASVAGTGVGFMAASPAQRLALLERLDREQQTHMDAREAARRRAREPVVAETPDAARAGDPTLEPEITADTPAHWFRMMKELALLGYFTSEIGYTQAMRYEETPGRYDPCVPYSPGERAWAPHA